MWMFRVAEWLSVAYYIRKAVATRLSRRAAAIFIDCWILGWLALELSLLFTLDVTLIVLVLTSYRLFEVIQAYINILLFHRIRHPVELGRFAIVSHTRTLLIGMLSYVEVGILFSFIYLAKPELIRPALASAHSALYFSFVTLATLGYGDYVPLGNARGIAIAECLIGVFFVATLLARFVALLPSAPQASTE